MRDADGTELLSVIVERVAELERAAHGADIVKAQTVRVWIGVPVTLVEALDFLLGQVEIENNAMAVAQQRRNRVVQQNARAADRRWIKLKCYESEGIRPVRHNRFGSPCPGPAASTAAWQEMFKMRYVSGNSPGSLQVRLLFRYEK
jgi:hypothetical protein